MILTKDNIAKWQRAVEIGYEAHMGIEIGDWFLHYWNLTDAEMIENHLGEDSATYVEEMIIVFNKDLET